MENASTAPLRSGLRRRGAGEQGGVAVGKEEWRWARGSGGGQGGVGESYEGPLLSRDREEAVLST